MAHYDNLTGPQRAEFDRLMTVPINTWPDTLITRVHTMNPVSTDALAHTVAGWVKDDMNPVSHACPPCPECGEPPRLYGGTAVLRHAPGCPEAATEEER